MLTAKMMSVGVYACDTLSPPIGTAGRRAAGIAAMTSAATTGMSTGSTTAAGVRANSRNSLRSSATETEAGVAMVMIPPSIAGRPRRGWVG